MSRELTRDELTIMFGVQNHTRLSEYPFEIPSEMVQHILDTDAGHRKKIRTMEMVSQIAEKAAKEQADGLTTENAALRQQLAASEARIAKLEEALENGGDRQLLALFTLQEQLIHELPDIGACSGLAAAVALIKQQLTALYQDGVGKEQ